MRRVAAVAAVALGVVLIATPIVTSLFSRSRSAERLSDSVRPAMTKAALTSDRSGLETVRGALSDFNGPTRVSLAHALRESPAQFDASLRSDFPAVAAGARELPVGYVPHSDLILTTLERNRVRFDTADDTPVSWVSASVGPWIFVALGVALVVAGLLVLRSRGPGGLVALLLLGLVPLVFALAASLPHKASSTDALVHNLAPAFTPRSAGRVPGEVATAQRFDRQLENGLVPSLERQLHETPQQLDAFLGRSSPNLARALPQLDPIVTNFGALGAALVADRHFYLDTAKIDSRATVWVMIGASIVVLLAAALALVSERRAPMAQPA